LHLEDQVMPKRCGHLSGKALVDVATMVAKIRAAVAARRDPDFVIVARTDARSVEGFDAATARARAYLAAGADMIFPEALESAEEFARFAQEIPSPKLANMTEFGRSPLLSFNDLADLGFQAVLYPLTVMRAAMHAAEQTLRTLRDQGSQRDLLDRMQSRAELYDLLGYTDWEARDRAYFAGNPGPRGEG
jgi:methylisocitrate lyase